MKVESRFVTVWNEIHDLFSTILVIDSEMRIIYANDKTLKKMPQLRGSPHLNDIFEIKRPTVAVSFEDLKLRTNTLFLMIARDSSFAVRGQVLVFDGKEGDFLIFMGAPWLYWLRANQPDIELGLNDFSPHDAQLDQLFFMTTEQQMIKDLQSVNDALKDAKTRMEDAQHAKDIFFATMSHEMRTPLNGLISALSLLEVQAMPTDAARLLHMAMASSRNLLEVIDYVLDVSEIEANDDAREQLFDPETLLSEVISVIQAKAIEKGIYLESSVDSSVRRNFVGDYKHLHQSLLNLSINAINFTHHGHVKLEAKSPISEDFSLRLEVSDTGVGIEKDQMAQIFEPFQSTRAVASNPGGRGTGLGLDIVRRSVESMQGAIGVESESGKGSLFWIELPLKESEQALPQSDQEPDVTGSPADIAPQLSGRVMLVDDNETNLMLGAMLLENAGLEVTPVSSGIEAIRLADPSRVDIILMDISMPNIDGYEATRRIRERYNDMPIIALSAYASSVEKTKAYASGMNDYLVKPINLPEVVRVLSGYLNGSSQLSLEPDSPTSESMPECLLDREAIGVLLSQVGEENYKLVMKKFQHEARQRWSQLEAAQDFDSAAREAHTLASTCASFGLPGISKAFKEIEDKANRGLPSYADGFGSIGLLLEQGLEELANFAA